MRAVGQAGCHPACPTSTHPTCQHRGPVMLHEQPRRSGCKEHKQSDRPGRLTVNTPDYRQTVVVEHRLVITSQLDCEHEARPADGSSHTFHRAADLFPLSVNVTSSSDPSIRDRSVCFSSWKWRSAVFRRFKKTKQTKKTHFLCVINFHVCRFFSRSCSTFVVFLCFIKHHD